MSNGKKTASSTNGVGKMGQPHEKNETEPFPISHTKIDFKWMKDLNVRKESIKILKENTGSHLFNLSHSNFFLETSPKAREARVKMNY